MGHDENEAVTALRACDPVIDDGYIVAEHFINGAAKMCPVEAERLRALLAGDETPATEAAS
jgi:hypothetical protein